MAPPKHHHINRLYISGDEPLSHDHHQPHMRLLARCEGNMLEAAVLRAIHNQEAHGHRYSVSHSPVACANMRCASTHARMRLNRSACPSADIGQPGHACHKLLGLIRVA